ncbi:MAG: hypothetical protein ACO3O7_05670 [Ilumatobacteraceae bacterium]
MNVATLELTLQEANSLVKSVSRSLDAEAKKLTRLRPGTPVFIEVTESYQLLDTINTKLRDLMRDLVARGGAA